MCYFRGDCGWAYFWPIQVIFVVAAPLCGVGTPLLSSNNFTQGHSMKIEWLVIDVTAIRSPGRQSMMYYFWDEYGWACFWPIQVVFVVGETLCGVGTPS